MRVTSAVREYVRKTVCAKVADKIEAAEDAKEAAIAVRDAKVAKAKELCKQICAEAHAKFVKEVKKQLGLTFIPDIYRWDRGIEKGGNLAVKVDIDRGDFMETLSSEEDQKAQCNPCAERDEFVRIVNEPTRIKDAANAAADKLLFELELGKVAKAELDGLLNELKVEI